MFVTDDIIGDVVLFSFQDVTQFSDVGISNSKGHYLASI